MPWSNIKDLSPVVTSIIAVMAAIISAGAWVTGYFATQQQLDKVQCVSTANEELLSLQIESANAYANYTTRKIELSNLKTEGTSITKSAEERMEELKRLKDVEWERLTLADKKAEHLASEIIARKRCK